jgi:hydroxymethylpyrimidine pyrophosphatase-like HAD family hydrolase
MKFAALALDYDGTIATDGVFNAAVREAIGEARARGVAVVLVTGRRLADLREAAGDLSCFDVIVAENGGVLEFPGGRHVLVGHPTPPSVVQEVRRRRIAADVGECVLEADAGAAANLLDVIRTLEQPLVLAFNRGRVMVLPQGVAKSTGLRQALFALRISIHNTIGIGDAENDHDLLDACEVGVAVAWGSAALRAVADNVIEGSEPGAVAAYIRRVCQQLRLVTSQTGRRRLRLGREHNGTPVELAVRGRTILIAGEPGTGKSWLAGLLCEQLILQNYCVCIIDPEGDYRSLEALPNVITLGGDDPPPGARDLVRALSHPDVSVIVDLSKLTHREKGEYLSTLLPALATLRRQTGLPHKILLDEAHYFLADAKGAEQIDVELAGYILITYRVSCLEASVRATDDAVVIVTRERDPIETETLHSMCHPPVMGPGVFGSLAPNEAALLPGSEEAHGTIRRFTLAPRLTGHVRHQTKYLDMPVAEHQAFVFGSDAAAGPRARTLKVFVGMLVTLPGSRLAGHLRRHDFSRWIKDVFRDHPLASRLSAIEGRLEVDDPRELAQEIAQAVRARYETTAELETHHG